MMEYIRPGRLVQAFRQQVFLLTLENRRPCLLEPMENIRPCRLAQTFRLQVFLLTPSDGKYMSGSSRSGISAVGFLAPAGGAKPLSMAPLSFAPHHSAAAASTLTFDNQPKN